MFKEEIVKQINNYKVGEINKSIDEVNFDEVASNSKFIIENTANSILIQNIHDPSFLLNLVKEGNYKLLLLLSSIEKLDININIEDSSGATLLQYLISSILREEDWPKSIHFKISDFFKHKYELHKSDIIFISRELKKHEDYSVEKVRLILLFYAFMKSNSSEDRKTLILLKNEIGFLSSFIMEIPNLTGNYKSLKEPFHYLLKRPKILPIVLPVMVDSKAFRKIRGDSKFKKSVLKAFEANKHLYKEYDLVEIRALQILYPNTIPVFPPYDKYLEKIFL